MRISDWSSDVCSSDLPPCDYAKGCPGHSGAMAAAERSAPPRRPVCPRAASTPRRSGAAARDRSCRAYRRGCGEGRNSACQDRESGVEGKRGSGRVDLGGGLLIKKKKKKNNRLR